MDDAKIETTDSPPVPALPVLEYCPPPKQIDPAVNMSIWAIVCVAGIPFVAFFLLHGRRKIWIAVLQFLVIPAAFGFFGPVWGAYIFKGTPYSEWGLYPFIASVVGALLASLLITIRAHNEYHQASS